MHLSLSVSLAILLARPFVSAASDLAYCSSENTGSSFSAVLNNYQSNGACETTCKSYAFGVLQGKKCWCSNVAPSSSSTSKTSNCDTSCPGYPSDSCGSAAQGVYAYVAISGNSATSTAKGSGSSTTSTSASTSSVSASTTSSSTLTTSTSDRVVQTTSNGEVVTITKPAPSATAGSSSSNSGGGSSLSGGSIAGIVIGVLGGLALIAALVFLVFFYRRRSRAVSPAPSQDMTDNRTSQGSSFMRGVFPQGGHMHDSSAQSGNGRPNQFTDNRLRTDAVVYSHGRQDSSTSLQDNEDYSRPVLRLTNPD